MIDKWGHTLLLHACEGCGKERYVRHTYGKPLTVLCKPCSKGRPKEFHLMDTGGYVGVYLSKGNPFYPLADSDGRVKQHRLVMAQALAQRFRSVDAAINAIHMHFVHHKDGDKLNNSINNLLLCTRGEHSRIHRRQEWVEFGARRRQS